MASVTEVIRLDSASPDSAALERAASCLREGGLVAFPTETVYGLGVHALDPEAVRRAFQAKQRPADDPLIVHVAAFADLAQLVVEIPDVAESLAARFWPGPLTLVLRRSGIVPDEVTAGLDTVAVRAPSHPVARALIARAAVPIAAPSANLFSRPSPTRAEHVLEDLDGRIDMIVDAGPTTVGLESTVLDLTCEPPMILRPGAVSAEQLRAVLGEVGVTSASRQPGPQRSPGLLPKHYAPRAPLTLYTGPAEAALDRMAADVRSALGKTRVGLALTTEDLQALRQSLGGVTPAEVCAGDLGPADEPDRIASRLYFILRELDASGVDLILARDHPGDTGLALAIRDRLRRAAVRLVNPDRPYP